MTVCFYRWQVSHTSYFYYLAAFGRRLEGKRTYHLSHWSYDCSLVALTGSEEVATSTATGLVKSFLYCIMFTDFVDCPVVGVIHKESGDADMYTTRQPEQVTATVTPLSARRSRPLFLIPHAAKGLQHNTTSSLLWQTLDLLSSSLRCQHSWWIF